MELLRPAKTLNFPGSISHRKSWPFLVLFRTCLRIKPMRPIAILKRALAGYWIFYKKSSTFHQTKLAINSLKLKTLSYYIKIAKFMYSVILHCFEVNTYVINVVIRLLMLLASLFAKHFNYIFNIFLKH